MKESSLLKKFRRTTVEVAVDFFRNVHRVKEGVKERYIPDPSINAPETLGQQLPSPVTVSDFLGEVASLGLDQVNGLLRLRDRYGDEIGGWLADQVLPRPRATLPEPQLVELTAIVGRRATIRFMVKNSLSRRAAISFAEPLFRTADGCNVAKIRVSFSPMTIELDPGQPWIFAADLDLRAETRDPPLAPGRYVGLIGALVDRRVVHRLVVNLNIVLPGSST